MTKKMTDNDLVKEFQRLNERFFDNKIKLVEIRFMKKMPRNVAGAYNPAHEWIHIDDGLRKFWSEISVVLLHEMAHADLNARGYRGYPEDGGHGGLFQVELDRLYRAGAYDGLL